MTRHERDVAPPNDWDRRGLPGWCYHSPALLRLEQAHVFQTHWQIAGHVSDLPEPGSYLTLDAVGERAVVVRGQDGVLRGFLNMCRHRGSRVVAEPQGRCKGALVCPFHGWVYNLDGSLRGPARPRSFPTLDKIAFGLEPIEVEEHLGLVFLRFRPGPQPSVAALLGPFASELANYRIADMVPAGSLWTGRQPINWKSVRDVDNEGYHVAMAHPALQDLYGDGYADSAYVDGLSRSIGPYNSHPGRRWSVARYRAIAPAARHLPPHLRQAWLYYGLFPNCVIAVTPELMQFYQEFPLTTGETVLRGGFYRHRDESRQLRLARYLCHRIDRETYAEDIQLSRWSNEAAASERFAGFYLSDLEYGVRTHHDHLRRLLPVMRLEQAPDEGEIAALNEALLAQERESLPG